jgi:hypothetical protein
MKHKSRSPKQRKQPKTRLRLPDLEFSKTSRSPQAVSMSPLPGLR